MVEAAPMGAVGAAVKGWPAYATSAGRQGLMGTALARDAPVRPVPGL